MARFELHEYDDYGFVGIPASQPFPESFSETERSKPKVTRWYVEFNDLDALLSYIRKYSLTISTNVEGTNWFLSYDQRVSEKVKLAK